MAQKYLKQLIELMEEIGVEKNTKLECKHFFSGAACYLNGKIFASLSPVGFALKLPEEYRNRIMKEGGKNLQYFSKAPIKKEYVVLPQEITVNTKKLTQLVKKSIEYTLTNEHS